MNKENFRGKILIGLVLLISVSAFAETVDTKSFKQTDLSEYNFCVLKFDNALGWNQEHYFVCDGKLKLRIKEKTSIRPVFDIANATKTSSIILKKGFKLDSIVGRIMVFTR